MLRRFRSWFDRPTSEVIAFTARDVVIGKKQYHLRPMVPEDVDQALEIERRIYLGTPWDRFAFLTELRKVRHSLYLVLEDGALMVAFIGGWFTTNESHITNIAVDPAYQRMGIGRFLMQLMISEADNYGSRTVTLEVKTTNEAAKTLYQALGFLPGKVKKGYYVSDHSDALDMTKTLH